MKQKEIPFAVDRLIYFRTDLTLPMTAKNTSNGYIFRTLIVFAFFVYLFENEANIIVDNEGRLTRIYVQEIDPFLQ